MSKNYRPNLVSRIGELLSDVVAAEKDAEHGRKRQPNDLRAAWINADRMIGICKF